MTHKTVPPGEGSQTDYLAPPPQPAPIKPAPPPAPEGKKEIKK